jgi:hypothetical protein
MTQFEMTTSAEESGRSMDVMRDLMKETFFVCEVDAFL